VLERQAGPWDVRVVRVGEDAAGVVLLLGRDDDIDGEMDVDVDVDVEELLVRESSVVKVSWVSSCWAGFMGKRLSSIVGCGESCL